MMKKSEPENPELTPEAFFAATKRLCEVARGDRPVSAEEEVWRRKVEIGCMAAETLFTLADQGRMDGIHPDIQDILDTHAKVAIGEVIGVVLTGPDAVDNTLVS